MPGGYLSGIFGASPIRPLQKHMSQVIECVTELIPFVDAVLAHDTEARTRHHRSIIDREHAADTLKKELRLHLPTSLFMPIDRRDVLEVLTMQDRVAGAVRSVAGVMVGRDMHIPEPLQADYRELVKQCVDACNMAFSAICELDELVETGFGTKEIELVNGILDELDTIEQNTDEKQVEVRHALFTMEKELPPVDVMFLYRTIDKTGEIADRAQRVGSRLQLILAK
ncbi:MAG: TIGR00153 family protein [Xanthomonadales bacterium]|nr:TIGR00153 family protein [Xanthomonadales bacterium]